MGEQDRRGILYPARLPTFDRLPAPDGLDGLVRWFWIPRWDIAPGRTSRQETLPFPASNLVVEPARVTLSGPTTTRSHRDLRGSGWAVGALLRPAAIAQLVEDPRAVRDLETTFDAPDLHAEVAAAMRTDADPLTRAATAYTHWLTARLVVPDSEGELANLMEDTVAGERSLTKVEHLADRLGVSVRTVQRLAQRYVGVPPLAMIRRYRLQEAAQRLREDADISVGDVAAELGYADQAHLCADFRTVLGFNPSAYRAGLSAVDEPTHG